MTENLLDEKTRRSIAERLRYVAESIEQGRVTPHEYSLEAQWIPALPNKRGQMNTRPTGLTYLNLSYWITPIDALAE